MTNSISCPVCQNLCSSQAVSCPRCGHPFTKEYASVPSFLENAEEDAPAQPFYLIIFRVLAVICLVIGVLFGIMLLVAPFTNPDFGKVWGGILVRFVLGMLGYAFFSFLSSMGKRK